MIKCGRMIVQERGEIERERERESGDSRRGNKEKNDSQKRTPEISSFPSY
jgi:hypothetical protein